MAQAQRQTAQYLRAFVDARRVSAPLVVVRTPDQFASREALIQTLQGIKAGDKLPADPVVLAWDAARGLTAPAGHQSALNAILKAAGVRASQTVDLTETLLAVSGTHVEERAGVQTLVPNVPDGTVVILHNVQRHWTAAPVAQALANIRDEWKRRFVMALCLIGMADKPPDEIKHDCIVFDVPLPDSDALATIAQRTIAGAGVTVDEAHVARVTDYVRGLGSFVAETSISMALRRSGVKFDELLEQRIAAIEQVDGVQVYRGTETFADIVGLDGIKRAFARLKTARRPVRVVVVFDEFEKTMGGSQAQGGDNTGIKQGMSGHLLTWMQNRRVRGSIAFGHPGTGKSLVGKALANELGCICLMVDLNRALNSLVGASEQNLRAITDMIDALSGDGGAFVIATCNSMHVLTTELRRRFNRGLFFFDLPTATERAAAWDYYGKRYGVGGDRPTDEGWTPSEIAVACEQANDYDVPLAEAAENVVPVAISQPEVIAERRHDAHQRLIDASTGRPYAMPGAAELVDAPVFGRAIADMPND